MHSLGVAVGKVHDVDSPAQATRESLKLGRQVINIVDGYVACVDFVPLPSADSRTHARIRAVWYARTYI